VAPVPLQYQVLGGEAKNLIPVELMEHMEIRLLKGMGIPSTMYEGQSQPAAPHMISFEMFERSWQQFPRELSAWVTWMVRKQGELMSWPDVKARLVPISIETDEIRKQKIQEMGAGGIISKTTWFRTMKLNRAYEDKMIKAEADAGKRDAEAQQKKDEAEGITTQALQSNTTVPGEQQLQEDQQAQQQSSGAAGPGPGSAGPGPAPAQAAPGGAGGGLPPMPSNPTPDQLEAYAQSVAEQLYTMPQAQKTSQLIELSHSNPTLHDLVKGKLEDIDNNASLQGRVMARAGQMPQQ
jgi:hypothetical protein